MKIDFDKPALVLAVALPLLWLAFLRLLLLNAGENCFDGYYHIAMADGGPSVIFSKSFPSLTMSVWESSFSDKESLYHLALWLVRGVQGFFGLSLDYPFHFPALAMELFALCCFVFALRKLSVKACLLPALALVSISPFFVNRFLMMRPHVFAIGLMCAGLAVFALAKGRKGALLSLGLGAVFSWAYSNPHFILLPAFCMGVARLKDESFKEAFAPLLFAAAGVVGAQIVHPQFPNTLVNWWIQCVDVMEHSLAPDAWPIRSPNELRAADYSWLSLNLLVYLLFAFDLWLFLALKAKLGIKRIPASAAGAFAAAAIAIAGSFFGIRAMEYACPFSIISAALLTSFLNSLPDEEKPFGFKLSKNAWLPLLIGLLMAAFACALTLKAAHIKPVKATDGLALWAERTGSLPPGTLIANLAWSDFTILHYSLPQCRYLCGLDPMFGYRRSPEAFSKICRFAVLEAWMTPEELARTSGAKFAFVRAGDAIVGKSLAIGGYKTVYKGPEGWLFQLPQPVEKP